LSEGYAPLEPQVEALVRQQIRRGTVQVHLQIDRQPGPDDYRLNATVLSGYLKQLEGVLGKALIRDAAQLAPILSLPGVVDEPRDVIREVGLFAERSDISEEIVRLKSHLEQFDTVMAAPESQGRKLEFLTQEMFRETNTIGSKANDAEIARHVIEIKTAIERMREMIQNVE